MKGGLSLQKGPIPASHSRARCTIAWRRSFVLGGGLAHHSSSVAIDKSDRPAAPFDTVLKKICIEGMEQDW
jgi:hypothetical protein